MDRRLQILLAEERYQKVAHEAERRGVSIAVVIRDAIDQLPDDRESRHVAIAAILAAEPMAVEVADVLYWSSLTGGVAPRAGGLLAPSSSG